MPETNSKEIIESLKKGLVPILKKLGIFISSEAGDSKYSFL